jgi:hypothetical protein
MHGEFLHLLFLQAHRETEAHFTATGMPSQHNSDEFRFCRAAFYKSLKSEVGLVESKAAALRINLNIPDAPAHQSRDGLLRVHRLQGRVGPRSRGVPHPP